MADEVRVFDSVTAAVENSLPPAPPPYAFEATDGSLPAAEPEPVPETRRTNKRRPVARTAGLTAPVEPEGGHVVAGAGTAGVDAKAQDPA